MKKLLLLTLLLIGNYSFSQKKINIPVSNEGKSNNGIYTYKANVEFQVRPEGLLVDVIVARKVTNYEITSYTYKNINATEVGYTFPIKVNSFTNKAFVDIQFYKGTVSYTARNLQPNGSTYLSDSQLKNLFNTFNIDPKKRDCITCDAIKEVKQLNIKAYNVRLEDLGYKDIFSEINTKIDKLIREKKEKEKNRQKVNDIKNQINSLGNTKENLQEKKSLYQKLDSIDTENEYSSEINNIEEEIENLNKKEEEKEKQKLKESESSEDEESDEEKKENLKEAAAEKERNKVREKQETEERERERQARIQEKVKDYKNKVKDANKRNQQLASASAASSASFLYVVGGFIYSNMGSNSGDIYGEGFNNFHFGLDFGYSLNTTPLVFNSNMEDIDESTGNVFNVEKFIPSQSITVDLGLKMLMAAEGQNYRAEGYVGIKGGFSPIFDSFRSDLYYGFEANGGVSWIKAVLGLEWGNKSYSKSNILDSQEIGNAKSSFGSKKLKYGLKFSWYGNTDYARHHLSFGLIKEQIISLGDNIYIEDLDDNLRAGSSWIGESSLETYNDKYADLSTYTGYFLKWVHDHHSTLTIEVYPKYPRTGEITVNQFDPDDFSNQGSLFFNIGFTRNLDWFTFKK